MVRAFKDDQMQPHLHHAVAKRSNL